MSRVSFYTRPYDRLEPYDGKLSRTVLRGGAGSNASLLPDIRSEKDILKLVTTIIANTKGEGEKSSEDFWVKAEKLLYTALIAFIWYEGDEEEKNLNTLLDLLNESETREEDETYQNPVDMMFQELEERDPQHFAVRQYKKYKMAAGKTAKSILISCGARLAPFDIAELRAVSYTHLGKSQPAFSFANRALGWLLFARFMKKSAAFFRLHFLIRNILKFAKRTTKKQQIFFRLTAHVPLRGEMCIRDRICARSRCPHTAA